MSGIYKLVLLVEDNPNDEVLTLRGLRRNKIANEIIVARDGQEALDYLFGMGGRERVIPALILLDMNLPKLNGLDVLRRIRADERTKTLPVVILTSSRQERDLVESYQLGCNSYVCKPLDFDEFIKAANTLSVYWLILNEPPNGDSL
jgi:two-component system response regulator